MKESNFHDCRDLQGSREMESWEIIGHQMVVQALREHSGGHGVPRGAFRYTPNSVLLVHSLSTFKFMRRPNTRSQHFQAHPQGSRGAFQAPGFPHLILFPIRCQHWGPLFQCLLGFPILTQAANFRSPLNCKMAEPGLRQGGSLRGTAFPQGHRLLTSVTAICRLLQAHVCSRPLLLLITVHRTLCTPNLHLPHLSAICAPCAGAGAGVEFFMTLQDSRWNALGA